MYIILVPLSALIDEEFRANVSNLGKYLPVPNVSRSSLVNQIATEGLFG